MNPRVILHLVCAYYGLAPKCVLAGKRSQVCVVARRMTIALAREHTVFSGTDIANALGVDHTTVVHARTSHARALTRDPNYARDTRAIATALLGTEKPSIQPELLQ